MKRADSTVSGTDLRVACFGEALWDVLPGGIFMGGAPLNVAYHLSRQGVRPQLLSAVGRDVLGTELRRRLVQWGLDPATVPALRQWPTGIVRATLDRDGAATYDIQRRVAWDHIPAPGLVRNSPAPAALVYGSLALREAPNRKTLEHLLASWPAAWRVLDLNLRPPFAAANVLRFALRHAQLLKLNEVELRSLAGRACPGRNGLEKAARLVAHGHGLARVCVTAGARGAGLLWDGAWHWEDARQIDVHDTVGAGDAFLAAFIAATLRGQGPARALAHACRMGEFVASRPGATPAYTCDPAGRPRALKA